MNKSEEQTVATFHKWVDMVTGPKYKEGIYIAEFQRGGEPHRFIAEYNSGHWYRLGTDEMEDTKEFLQNTRILTGPLDIDKIVATHAELLVD